MPERWQSDEELLVMLRGALTGQDEPVPPSVVEAGYAAFSWRTIDAELAALTYDSSREPAATAGARSHQAPLRAMTFATSTVTVELEVAPSRLLGQVIPPGPHELLVRLRDDSTRVVPVDELGCFSVDPLPRQPFRLVLAGEVQVTTDWVAL